ncbi:hypothetical protein QR77_41470 [Streptomyces sp. 150FB]|uniref:hypothetical protein n=1 Tax=Streptomyces sp. 150FB TaxID=1576605 RepID=UPI0005890437|nr:hypothetical protein [Streptomyces sp. 150FB]KIF72754.1 hypothetical protein QR77_41470 [Streptomyces sp. 150FB]
MRTMIARHLLLVTTSGEPEPRHDRPTDTPPAPTRPRLLRASTPAEIQREEEDRAGDDGLGYERDETDNLLVRAEDEEDRPPLPKREPGKTLEDCLSADWRLAA